MSHTNESFLKEDYIKTPVYASYEIQAIIKGVWKLHTNFIEDNLQFILKRRATVREFVNALDTSTHYYKQLLLLPRDYNFEVLYHKCSYTSLVAGDWDQPIILSFRKLRNCPLRFVLVRSYDIIQTPDVDFLQIKPFVELAI